MAPLLFVALCLGFAVGSSALTTATRRSLRALALAVLVGGGLFADVERLLGAGTPRLLLGYFAGLAAGAAAAALAWVAVAAGKVLRPIRLPSAPRREPRMSASFGSA
jgi:hypothetical protein